jgi:hypothetical protein
MKWEGLTSPSFSFYSLSFAYETHMIDRNNKHEKNIIFNHVRFHPTFKIKIVNG